MHMRHQLPASDKPLKLVGGPQLCAIAGLLSGGTQIYTVFSGTFEHSGQTNEWTGGLPYTGV